MKSNRAALKSNSNTGYGKEVPPQLDHVKIIFCQQELEEKDALEFFNQFQSNGWTTKTGVPIKNWKQILEQWIWELKTQNPNRSFHLRKKKDSLGYKIM